MTHHWDEFSKSLAEPLPRRESLRRLAVVFAGAVLSPFGRQTASAGHHSKKLPDPCKAFCKCRNKKQQNQCLAACKSCNNDTSRLCGTCGDYFCCGNGLSCCGGYCADLAHDFQDCGACGYVCDTPGPYETAACIDGRCEYPCAYGAIVCDGACTPVSWDPNNCGDCGIVCGGTTPYCNQGTCSRCQPGWAYCNGNCIDVTYDNGNCGACGVICPSDQTCVGGYCQYTEPYPGDGTY
jgi:hypothetical protein